MKHLAKRLLCFLLVLVMLSSSAFLPRAHAATDYTDLILDIIDTFEQQDNSAGSAPQQLVNGAYRAAELLTVIAYELDSYGSYSSVISDIYDSLGENDKSTSSAPQQSVNGFYRCAELLCVIAVELDDSGSGFYKDFALQVLDDMETNNARCNGAPQQIVNGVYRMFDALTIIAYEMDVDSSLITSISDTLESNDSRASGADHQIVNGLYRCVELLYLITSKSCGSYLQDSIDEVLDDLSAQDNRVSSAPQQEVNGAYRLVELLAYWGIGNA